VCGPSGVRFGDRPGDRRCGLVRDDGRYDCRMETSSRRAAQHFTVPATPAGATTAACCGRLAATVRPLPPTSVGWVVAGRFGDFGFSDPRPSGSADLRIQKLRLRARALASARTSVPHARDAASVAHGRPAKRPCQDQAHGSIGRPCVATRTRRYGLPRWSKPLRSSDGELAVQQCTVGPQQQRREGTNRGEQG
jgi:hypothetical protein